MQIGELTLEERTVLVGLLKVIIQADQSFSEEELAGLNRIAAMMGPLQWKEAKTRAQEQFRSRDDMRAAARTVVRQDARKLIYELLYEMAGAEKLSAEEAVELDWLGRLWSIEKPAGDFAGQLRPDGQAGRSGPG